jgi:hypothetical protein
LRHKLSDQRRARCFLSVHPCSSPTCSLLGRTTPITYPTATLSCSNAACQKAICAQDAYCCETRWDSICVNEVPNFCTCAP